LFTLWIGVMFFLLLSACSDDEPASVYPEEFTRTLFVYLAGDNNLSYETDEKIESMLKGWNGEGGNLIIYQDKKQGSSTA